MPIDSRTLARFSSPPIAPNSGERGPVAVEGGLRVNGPMFHEGERVLIASVTVGTVASTTSTVAWSEWMATAVVLPAGTWAVSVLMNGEYFPSGAAGGLEVRIGAPVVGTAPIFATSLNISGSAFCAAQGSVISDGVAPTVFRAEYRRHPSFTGTPNARGALLHVICRRVS